ncbi:hypothetical protein CPB83DRAFT_838519 [Crepidotus variabilis]|uniref:BTB domain-containing protein n=1 Tax=Crepidotus variabilis TaxID=179855 RepID=A0A9P6E9Y9_9AGAR|nr:hypothetical protein CPB83DRAFT_838519 [Crepidotus variabilis]
MATETENTETQCDGKAVVERHDMYFFDFVVFQVQNTLFRVPKHGFLDLNPAFFDKFAPVGSTSATLDANEADPIELKDIPADDFKALLLVIYPFKRTAETYEEWLGALGLATQWDLADIRSKSISALSMLNRSDKKSPVEVALLAKKYRIKDWLLESYIQLVHSDDLNLRTLRQQEPENTTLDWETISRLFSARLESIQWARSRRDCLCCPQSTWFCAKDCRLQWSYGPVKARVESAFADELAALLTPDAGMPQSLTSGASDSKERYLFSDNLVGRGINTSYAGGSQYHADAANEVPPQPERLDAVEPVAERAPLIPEMLVGPFGGLIGQAEEANGEGFGLGNERHIIQRHIVAEDEDYTDTEDEVEVNCRRDGDYTESENEDDHEPEDEYHDESEDEDDNELENEEYDESAEDEDEEYNESADEDGNEPVEEHHEEQEVDADNEPLEENYNEPEDEGFNEPADEHNSEPEVEDNEPEPEYYDEPEVEDYTEPEDGPYDEPEEEGYDEPEDEAQSDFDDYDGYSSY